MSASESKPKPKQQAASPELAETVVTGRDPESVETRTDIVENATTAAAKSEKSPAKQPQVTPNAKAARKVSRLGDFELRKQIGQGGMGKVYLAHQVSLDRDCALKVMSGELAGKPGFVERFIREARAMAKIDHPNVVKCFAVDEQAGKHYVAMELIDGQSMQDWLDDLDVLTVEDALHVILLCADALEHAHSLKMIHRDIKPDNILVTKNGLVKVADLGLAKALDDDMSMTQSGTGLGTPHYMPPEQARDAKHADARCDIYALGCTLYHFVTGKLPFAGDSVLELLTNKERGQFKSARRVNSKIPQRLDLIIDKMMAKDPKHRYASCTEVIQDLESLNMAAESLGFIDSDRKAVMRRSTGVSAADTVSGKPAATGRRSSGRQSDRQPGPKSGRAERTTDPSSGRTKRRKSESSADTWFVRYEDSNGRIKVSKMTKAQILQGLKSDRLSLKARVSRSAKDDFRPIAQVPVFEGEAQRSVTRVRAKQHKQGVADVYAKIERQYNRQKWWRLLGRFRDGTLGFVGLIVWLVIVAIAVVGLGFAVMYGYNTLGESLNL